MGARSAVAVTPDLDPSDFAHQTHALARYFAELAAHMKNHVLVGGLGADPSTGSTQATGAAGVTDWNADHTAVDGLVDGVQGAAAAATDLDIHSGTIVHADFQVGFSIVASHVLKNDSGVISVDTVIGVPAATGDQKPPTDAEIQTALGAGVAWIKLFESTLNRTADTTVTDSQHNTVRPVLGVSVGEGFGVFTG
jgi:hypothetical protein